jgi:hypothetical protein
MKKFRNIASFIYFLFAFFNQSTARNIDVKELQSDLEIVWPLVQIVKVEYDLVNAQLELLTTEKERKTFLETYEEFVKKKYFDQVKTLNLRQGKLLLLLIHRETGRTPFDLLTEYRNLRRAISWQRMARLVGADLRAEYSANSYPEIEKIVKELIRKNGLVHNTRK